MCDSQRERAWEEGAEEGRKGRGEDKGTGRREREHTVGRRKRGWRDRVQRVRKTEHSGPSVTHNNRLYTH